jgi:hypothetical protein
LSEFAGKIENQPLYRVAARFLRGLSFELSEATRDKLAHQPEWVPNAPQATSSKGRAVVGLENSLVLSAPILEAELVLALFASTSEGEGFSFPYRVRLALGRAFCAEGALVG